MSGRGPSSLTDCGAECLEVSLGRCPRLIGRGSEGKTRASGRTIARATRGEGGRWESTLSQRDDLSSDAKIRIEAYGCEKGSSMGRDRNRLRREGLEIKQAKGKVLEYIALWRSFLAERRR